MNQLVEQQISDQIDDDMRQEWIDALQLLLDLELSLLRAQTDQALAHATLEQLLGTPESKPAPINNQQTH